MECDRQPQQETQHANSHDGSRDIGKAVCQRDRTANGLAGEERNRA
jgi:hypothetical protein